jgi:hypothetical protein
MQGDLGPGRPPSRWWVTPLALLVVFAVAAALRFPIAPIPLERDEGEYAYIAQRWLRGEVPYKGSFNQKPPGVFAAYLVKERLIGTSPTALHWGMQLYTFGTMTLLFFLGRRLVSPLAGFLAALFAAFLTADKGVLGNAANTEIYMLLPLTGAMLTTVRAVEGDAVGWAFATGVLSAAALLFKQVALPDVVFYGAVLLFCGRRWALPLGMVLGLVVGLLPGPVYFAAAGAWREFLDCTVLYNLTYVREVPLSLYPMLFWGRFQEILETALPVYALAALGLAVGWWWPRRQALPGGWRAALLTRPGLLLALWLLFSLLGVSTGGYFREHYFMQVIPAVAVLAGLGCVALTRLLPWPAARVAAPCLVAALVVFYGVTAAPDYYLRGTPDEKCRHLYFTNPFPEDLIVARYIREHSDPDDTVFVFGSEPQTYYYAGRKCASRYIFVYPLLPQERPQPDVGRRQQEVLDELSERRPRFIVYVTLSYSRPLSGKRKLERGVNRLLDTSYRLRAVVPGPVPLENGMLGYPETPMPLLTGLAPDRPPPAKPVLAVFERTDAGTGIAPSTTSKED